MPARVGERPTEQVHERVLLLGGGGEGARQERLDSALERPALQLPHGPKVTG